jgi:hypothetical protein
MFENMAMSEELLSSPDLFPFDIDITAGQIRIVRLSEATYQIESFLDQRVLTGTPVEFRIPVEDIGREDYPAAPHLNYIFHLGHVGSTLLSRVLGSGASVFSIREPLILRRLAGFEFELRTSFSPWPRALFNERLDTVLKLLARVYRPGQVSLVKATSFVGEMAPLLMTRAPLARAILLIARPQIFIAGILAGTASRAELAAVSGARIARLRHRFPDFGLKIDGLSEGELAALGWVTELLGLVEAHRRFPDRTLWVDFDEFLSSPRPRLEAILAHLNGGTDQNELAAILGSPDFGRYAKATEQAYDGSVRHRLIGEALVAHWDEVERGLAWINAAANRHPGIATATRSVATALDKLPLS